MATNGIANGHISTANGHLSSEDEEIDLRDNKYAVVTTSPQKRNCAESDPERDSIEDPASGPEDDLPERHQKAAAGRPYEEDMEVDEEDDLELEIACLNEDDTDSDGDEVDGAAEDEDFKDIGDEKGGGGVGDCEEQEEEEAGMTSAEEHELEVQHADPAICGTVSSSGGGGGGAVAGGGAAAGSGGTDGGAFPPHPNGSSVPAADVVVALEGPHDHPTGGDSSSSSSSSTPRRSCQEEGQQQQEEQTPQTVITTPLGRSTSPDRLPSFHYTQEVEGPRPPLRYSPDPQHLTLQEEEEQEEPLHSGPSTPPASPANAADAPTSPPAGCLPLPSIASHPREPIDNKSAEEDLTDPYNDDEGRELSGGFLEYLGTRMERSNSTEEKRDEEKAGEVPAAVDGASGEIEVDVKNVDPEGKPRSDAEDDEKDVDTTAVSASGPDAKAEQDDDAGDGGAETENGDKSTEEEKVGEGEATTESLEQTDDTAVDQRADVDAADKDVSDEKEAQKAEDEQSEEEEDDKAEAPEAVSNILVTVDESPDQKNDDDDDDEQEEEGKITDAEPADAVPVVVDDSQPQEEVKEADLLQMSDNEQEVQEEAPPAAAASPAPEDEQTPEEPEVAVRPESPAEAEPEATPADDDVTAEPQEEDDAAPEVAASPSPVPCEEVEPEITQTQPTATLEDNADNAVEDEEDTGADTQEEPAPAALEEKEEVSTQEETPVSAVAAKEDTEAADNASDEEQPTFIEHPSPTVEEAPQVQEEPLEEAAPEAQSNLRSGATGTSPRTPPGDITRAEDKFDDGIESVQSISNIKNRFQNKDEKPPMPGDSVRSGRSSNGHVNGDRTPPEVVNRSASQEDILGRELPPVNMARSMASKFRDMESTDSGADRKPVRKITPPREDVERDVGRYHDEVEHRGDVIRSDEPVEKGDERPPPSFTRNMLAKFKEMEDTEKPPPSPARSATSPTKRTHRPITTHIKSSPDEGIADTEPVNGHRGAEVMREADKAETEELPERGFTKSLVSQWRQIEQTAGGPTKSPLAPRQHGSTPSAVRNATTYRHASPANSESDDQREVVRESDNFEEENLPPPSYTKNMLAKFQNMQEEAQRDPATTPTKKQFKWTVKETKPLWAPPTGKDELQLQSVNGHDETNGDEEEVFSSEDEEFYDEDDISLECDAHGNPIYPTHHPKHPNNVRRRHEERKRNRTSRQVITSEGPAETELDRPAPETTKKLLSQFKSMEDVSAPPPTPEMSIQRQRSTRTSISAVPIRYSTQSSMESREQPDGIETTEVNTDRESSPEEHIEVVREADTDVAAELPEQGTTRNLLARFQSLQAV